MKKRKNALLKDTLRTIWRTKGRYISILAIVAIGTAFYAGVSSTCPDMKLTAQKYFEEKNLMDLRIKSTTGFDNNDIKAIMQKEGVIDVESGYSKDLYVNVTDKEKIIVSTYSYNAEKNINKLTLLEGRLPLADDECVVERNLNTPDNFAVGKTIKFAVDEDENIYDSIKYDEYKVVGIVESPMYIGYERGSSRLGDGDVTAFVYFLEDTYNYEYYTDLYATYENTHNISPFGGKYQQLIDENKEHMEEVKNQRIEERYIEIVGVATEDIEKSQKQLDNEKEKTEDEFKKADKKIRKSKKELKEAKKEYEQGLKKYKKSRKKLVSAKKELEINKEEYEKALNKYEKSKAKFDKQKEKTITALGKTEALVTSIEGILDGTITDKDVIAEIIEEAGNLEEVGENLRLMLETYISGNIFQAESIKQVIEQIKTTVSDGYAALEENEKNFKKIKKELDDTLEQIEDGEKELSKKTKVFNKKNKKTVKELKKAEEEIEKSEKKLRKSERQLKKQKEDFEEKVSLAQKEIDNNLAAINEIEKPIWYTFDRTSNPGYSGYESDADRVAKIALVFPIFFILVAALVCLTTMTRMIEEQTTEIGTLKALGYSNYRIMSKYIIYAASASVIGSVLGVIIGCKLFPAVIFNAYKITYLMPDILNPVRMEYLFGCMLISVICIIVTTMISCYKDLSAVPSQLMRPKTPPKGKRIFLEEISSLWEEIEFLKKVTFRNVSRYKKRVFLTVLGIGGCMALMFAGFGLKHSIGTIADKQFNDILKYDFIAVMDPNVTTEDTQQIYNEFLRSQYIRQSNLALQKTIDVSKGKTSKEANIFVMKYSTKLENYITLRERTTGSSLDLDDRGVIINEKLASLLGVKNGDSITIENSEVEVRGITENYTNNYIYMTPKIYQSIYGEEVKYNIFIGNMIDRKKKAELSTEMLKNENILSISYVDEVGDNFEDIVGSLDFIVLVMVLSAGALAFVVLYNLSNININERKREIATIKVLGFYDSEVSKYIYRENIFATILGILLGMIMGVPLAYFIVKTAEVDIVMFNPDPGVGAYIYSILLRLLFTLIVNIVLHFKLKKVDMISSLKSVE